MRDAGRRLVPFGPHHFASAAGFAAEASFFSRSSFPFAVPHVAARCPSDWQIHLCFRVVPVCVSSFPVGSFEERVSRSGALGVCQVVVEGDSPQTKTALHLPHGSLPENVLAVGWRSSSREARIIHMVQIDAHGNRALTQCAPLWRIALNRP